MGNYSFCTLLHILLFFFSSINKFSIKIACAFYDITRKITATIYSPHQFLLKNCDGTNEIA